MAHIVDSRFYGDGYGTPEMRRPLDADPSAPSVHAALRLPNIQIRISRRAARVGSEGRQPWTSDHPNP